jgi:YidC/Oxa1 family membrane protein insertase
MEERRLILAFALSFAVLLGFRMWTNSRYPQPASGPSPVATASLTEAPVLTPAASPAASASKPAVTQGAAAPNPRPLVPVVTGEEQRVELNFKDAEIAFSTKGARLLSWKLLDYKDPRGKSVEAHPGGNPTPGPLDVVTGRADLDERIRGALFRSTLLESGGERGARFEFSDGSLEVTKAIQSIKGGRAFRVEAAVREAGVPVQARVYWGPGFGQPTEDERSLRGYLPPDVVQIDENGADLRVPATALATPRTVRAKLIGVENKYFVAVMTREDGAPIDAIASTQTVGKETEVQIFVPPPVALTVGAKDYDRLQSLGLGVEKIVPVGSWLGPIVVPLTRALRAVNARVGNYGLAIILLTIAIGVTLAPLRHYAILSSAKMAKVAPQIRAVQERYKRLSLTDPKRQQMQQEIAEVYEKNGIDMIRQTAAGCLPTLLTMPFLFAFYRMLDISVDLKGAPFFWIPDLSLKDPLFITPILSGLSMIAMQRLMPAPAVDPAQQRMMLMMPIIFSGMFAWAPAGLNLYWFVSNLVAMGQQTLAMYFAPQLFPKARANP